MNTKMLGSTILLATAVALPAASMASEELAQKSNCLACHQVEAKLVGPSFKEIAEMYSGQDGAADELAGKIKNGSSGVWGQIPMPPNPAVSDDDIKTLVDWVLSL